MQESVSVKDLQGRLYRVKGNEPILLDHPQTVWVVQSGFMVLFAVTVKDGVIEGTRRYLFSTAPGEALFGTAPSSGNQHRQILAVPVGETELLKVDWECFRELVESVDVRIAAWVEGWLQQIGTALARVATPAIQVRAEGTQRFSLTSGQTFQPEPSTVCWVQVNEGNVRWMGFQELTLDSVAGVMAPPERPRPGAGRAPE